MPVPSAISDLSQTAGSNYPAGSESPTTADDYLRTYASYIAKLRDGQGFTSPVTLASAATTDIGGQVSQAVEISGTTTITSFGTNYSGVRFLKFTGALTLTHNATSLVLPGGTNITTVAGDTCIAVPNQALNGWTVIAYAGKSGHFSTITASGQITSTVSTGTAPLVIASTTKVANLNVDQLDGGDWAAPGAIGSTTPNTGAFTTLSASGNVTQTATSAGGTVSVISANADNTNASSNCLHEVQVGGGSAGDPFYKYTVSGVTNWVHGVDNSDSDAWVLSRSATPGTTNILRADSTGLSVTGALSASGGIAATSSLGLGVGGADRVTIDQLSSGVGRILGWGPSAGTNGILRFALIGSDANAYLPVMDMTSTGLSVTGALSASGAISTTATGRVTSFGSTAAVSAYSAWVYNNADVGYIGNGAGVVAGAAATDFGITAFTGGKLWLGSNNGSGYAVLDTAGNLGLGTVPSAWGLDGALELKNGRVVAFNGIGGVISSNAYYTTNWVYKTSNFAAKYDQDTGAHKWFTAPSGTAGNAISFTQALTLEAAGHLLPGTTDNVENLGSATYRWATVYAGTGTINTSDAREKTEVSALTTAEINAAKQLSKEIGTYKFLASIQAKGDAARTHIGMTVQRAIEIMEANGLDPFGYGFICHDVWEDKFVEHPAVEAVTAQEAVLDDEGNVVTPAVEAVEGKAAWTEQTQVAGDRYAFRYDQLNMFIAAGIEARLSALEAA